MQTNLKTRTRMLILNSYMKTFVLTFKFLNLGPVYIFSGQNYQETRLETLIIKKIIHSLRPLQSLYFQCCNYHPH